MKIKKWMREPLTVALLYVLHGAERCRLNLIVDPYRIGANG